MNLSKTQLRSALRLYTSSWRYLYGIKAGATRVDLDGNACGVLDEQHVEHARKQLEEAKARVQAQRAEQQAKKNVKLPLLLVRKTHRVVSANLVRLRAVKRAQNNASLAPISRRLNRSANAHRSRKSAIRQFLISPC